MGLGGRSNGWFLLVESRVTDPLGLGGRSNGWVLSWIADSPVLWEWHVEWMVSFSGEPSHLFPWTGWEVQWMVYFVDSRVTCSLRVGGWRVEFRPETGWAIEWMVSMGGDLSCLFPGSGREVQWMVSFGDSRFTCVMGVAGRMGGFFQWSGVPAWDWVGGPMDGFFQWRAKSPVPWEWEVEWMVSFVDSRFTCNMGVACRMGGFF